MLSIGLLRPGQHQYHQHDPSSYYAGPEREGGVWGGDGAKKLGLSGKVKAEILKNTFYGYTPGGRRKLVQNAGNEERLAAYDLTFSLTKDLSLLWSLLPDDKKQIVLEAHRSGVKAALAYLQQSAGYTRVGKGGHTTKHADFVFAEYEHFLSRANEPSIHTHAVLLNFGILENGRTRALDGRPVLQHKMAAGAIYRAHVGFEIVKALGVALVQKETWSELRDMPRAFCDRFSSRRKAIEQDLERTGSEGGRASAEANLRTREQKTPADFDEILRRVAAVGESCGFGPEEAKQICSPTRRNRPERSCRSEVANAIRDAVLAEGHFTRREIVRHTAEAVQAKGVSAKTILKEVDKAFANRREVILLGEYRGEQRYTTRGILKRERQLFETAFQLSEAKSKRASDAVIAEAEHINGVTLNRGQKNAVKHATQKGGRIHAISGMPGTGKTTLVVILKDVLTSQKLEVIGMSLSSKAARGLEDATGIPSCTIDHFLLAHKKGSFPLNKRSVLIVDEAGMVGTDKMAEVMQRVKKSGARIILIGDAAQLQPVEGSQAFQTITTLIGDAKITKIMRQQEPWARQAVRDMADGKVKLALDAFEARGLLDVRETPNEAISAMATSWSENGGSARPKEHLMIANTRAEVSTLNQAAQEERKQAGKLGLLSVQHKGERIYTGDRVLVTENSARLKVFNGELGTVLLAEPISKNILVHFDSGKVKALPLHVFKEVQLGYSVTAHRAQGVTVERDSYVLLSANGMTDAELSYVAMSRARHDTHLFTDSLSAGEGLSDLIRDMKRSQRKSTAHDIYWRNNPRQAPNFLKRIQSPGETLNDDPTHKRTDDGHDHHQASKQMEQNHEPKKANHDMDL